MPFTPPIAEQRFVLEQIVRLPDLAATDRFAAATPDVVDAVLEGAGQFAAGEWAPLLREGDSWRARPSRLNQSATSTSASSEGR